MPTRIESAIPLCVDLDGTLIHADMLFETLLALSKQSPSSLLLIPVWIARGGRALLKQEIARRVSFDPALLPYDERLLEYLRSSKAKGRRLILVTASDYLVAKPIADHLAIFDQLMASNATENLKGAVKASKLLEAFGSQGFDYAGNSAADLKVWTHSRGRVLVNCSNMTSKRAKAFGPCELELPREHSPVSAVIKALRVHQWVKNLLVYVPLITAHQWTDGVSFMKASVAFVAFSLVASGIYLFNDLLDIEADRHHPKKKRRPIASGLLPIPFAFLTAVLLSIGGISLLTAVSLVSAAHLAVYAFLAALYSLRWKTKPLIDIFLLAAFYTCRIVVGGFAIGFPPSVWLLAFSSFLFFSLALLKRYTELHDFSKANSTSSPDLKIRLPRRGYARGDEGILSQFGVASGFAANVVLALYIDSNIAQRLYRYPGILWAVAPLFLLWHCRVWLAASRGTMNQDPVLYSMKDRVTWWILLCTAACVLAASYLPELK